MIGFASRLFVTIAISSFFTSALAQNKWDMEYNGRPWTENISKPFRITQGLANRHVTVSTSHGKYWAVDKENWVWQRPRLFCTTEDLFTQTFTIPFLIPMLENAGAVVYTPRERDWQRNESIADNDKGVQNGIYRETIGKERWGFSELPGFAHYSHTYRQGENPFKAGSARICPTTNSESRVSEAIWQANLPKKGRYAVYVSYQNLNGNVDDAHYTVHHDGGKTEIVVNQRMGGGTWVYIGTYLFDPNRPEDCKVTLSNYSKRDGIVCADGVRFGGGMGNIARGNNGKVSGLPRFLEGARYNAQWSGFPLLAYSPYEGENDYRDDINCRSYVTNHLNGASIFNPDTTGLCVPIEAQFSVHSDAGFHKDNTYVGTLGICSTENDTIYNYPGGILRSVSHQWPRDLLSNLRQDLRAHLSLPWVTRGVKDANYSESKRPVVPASLVEMLSHQNWADMTLGHDPNFKFVFARSLYKTMARFVNSLHNAETTIQPLPVHGMSMQFLSNNNVKLTWKPTNDPTEPSAKPNGYVLYTRLSNGGFNNGEYISNNEVTLNLKPGFVYSFKVTAVNKGGESLESETLSAFVSPYDNKQKRILIINGFNRLSGPMPFDSETAQGFDLNTDAGVPYMRTPGFCGAQVTYSKENMGSELTSGTGYSGNELEGMVIAGNTFDYPFIHGMAITAMQEYSYVSCSREAVENGIIDLGEYAMVDLILGLEKNDGWSLKPYKTFTPRMQTVLSQYMNQGGRILVSGAFVASDMQSPEEVLFTSNILKYRLDTRLNPTTISTSVLSGCGINFSIPRTLNEESYAVQTSDCIYPVDQEFGFPAFAYTENNRCAGIAYQKGGYRVMALSFPFESITTEKDRRHIMSGILNFLLK